MLKNPKKDDFSIPSEESLPNSSPEAIIASTSGSSSGQLRSAPDNLPKGYLKIMNESGS